MHRYPSIRERSATLLINILIAYMVLILTTGRWLPTDTVQASWFICALAYWFLTLLSAPWFLPPRDAIISGVGAFLVLVTMQLDPQIEFANELETLRWCMVAFSVTEPHRVCRRLQLLRKWSHYEQDKEQVFF